MTRTDILAAVDHGARTLPQIAAELHVSQWDAELRANLDRLVLTCALAEDRQHRFATVGGAR